MTGAVLDALADRFGLDPRRVRERDRLAAAVSDAVAALGSPALVVDEVAAAGPLRGARDPWGVVLGRLRRVPGDQAARQRVAEDQARPVVDELAQRFGLDPERIARLDVFAAAVSDAVAALGSPALVVDEVAAAGPLRGARDGWSVILGRLRRIPALAAARQRARDDRAERKRWAAVDRAARRGSTLRDLVDRGVEYEDTALEQLAAEFSEPELRAVAVAALTGGGPR